MENAKNSPAQSIPTQANDHGQTLSIASTQNREEIARISIRMSDFWHARQNKSNIKIIAGKWRYNATTC